MANPTSVPITPVPKPPFVHTEPNKDDAQKLVGFNFPPKINHKITVSGKTGPDIEIKGLKIHYIKLIQVDVIQKVIQITDIHGKVWEYAIDDKQHLTWELKDGAYQVNFE